jgi:hypothetical protein
MLLSVGEIMGIGAVIGGVASAFGATSASNAQQSAASDASQTQLQMYEQMMQQLAPYMQTGVGANTQLQNLTGTNAGGNPLTSPLLSAPTANLNAAQLEQTPGYQFTNQQGLESVQNSAAARGLATSGAALKGAASYSTGLAEGTYQQQYENQVTNQTNQFNRLMGLTQLGQNSAAGVGAAGIQTGQNIGSNMIGAGNAAAAGINGAASSIGGAAQNYGFMNALQGMYQNQNNPIGTGNSQSYYNGLYDALPDTAAP